MNAKKPYVHLVLVALVMKPSRLSGNKFTDFSNSFLRFSRRSLVSYKYVSRVFWYEISSFSFDNWLSFAVICELSDSISIFC